VRRITFNKATFARAQKLKSDARHHPAMGGDACHTTKLPHSELLPLVTIHSLRIQHTNWRTESL
jgi:hypothetical protein